MEPIEIAADYHGRLVTAQRGDHVTTMTRAEIVTALHKIAEDVYPALDMDGIVLDESDLVSMRDLLDARSDKVADLKAEQSYGWQG